LKKSAGCCLLGAEFLVIKTTDPELYLESGSAIRKNAGSGFKLNQCGPKTLFLSISVPDPDPDPSIIMQKYSEKP
jgi:hypothetical protein